MDGLPDVLERFITYQKLSLSVRRKLMTSLLYPAVLIFLVICLIFFIIGISAARRIP